MNDMWRKSSYSVAQNDCVEVCGSLNAVRDSKNPDGPRILVDRAHLSEFLAAIKADRLV